MHDRKGAWTSPGQAMHCLQSSYETGTQVALACKAVAALASVASTATPSLERVRRAADLRRRAGSGGSGGDGGSGVEDPLGGGPSNKASQNRRVAKNARKWRWRHWRRWRRWLRWPRQQHGHWEEREGAADLRKRASGGGKQWRQRFRRMRRGGRPPEKGERWRQAVAALASVASTTAPSLERAKGGGRPPGAVASSGGGTGFGGLDNNTVAGKTEKGRPNSGSGGGKQWRHWFRWPRPQHRHWKE